ncbi:hypothetical protein [Algoriphagus confluentis]|uniref:PIN like domain-containing protein n=1 Tax=Algoriphagus confluentis TaxID=1697556 RepID=A0ABQ6PS85_9BACT|nr:hypothetical protein Aconfl_34340 [Algoriphagus confluentis]
MIKVYLDTNVLSGLKGGKLDEFKRLHNLLLELRGRVYCFFSMAHLNDLANDKSQQFLEDLTFYETITNDNFLVKEYGEKNLKYLLCTPKQAFETYREDSAILSLLDFGQLENLGELGEEEKRMIHTLKNQKIELDILKNSGKSRESDDFLKLYFGEIKDQYSVEELLKQFGHFYKALFEDPKNYRNLRRTILEQMPLVQKWNIKIEDINFDKKLEKTPLAKSFFQFVKDSMHNKEDDPNYNYDFFTNSYFNLNILGIDGENNKGVKFSNTLYDSFHSYYGAHCHFLVTNDLGLLTKSKVLYKFFGFDCKPATVSEFLKKFSITRNQPKFTNRSFLESILYQVKSGIISRDYQDIANLRQIREIKLNHWLLDFSIKLKSLTKIMGKHLSFSLRNSITSIKLRLGRTLNQSPHS